MDRRARLDEREAALATLEDAVQEGFFCRPAFLHDPWLDGLRAQTHFEEILELARARQETAKRALEEVHALSMLNVEC